MKYLPPYGSLDPNAGYTDGNPALGIAGSRVYARFFESVLRELTDLIENSGLEPDDEDWTQVRQAITLQHRVTVTKTMYVPAEYDTLQDALNELSAKFIPSNVQVIIEMAAGDHYVDASTGSVLLNLPFGNRVTIRGQTLTGGGFPAFTDVDNSSSATVEGVLRTRFPTVINIQGAVNGIFMQGGQIKMFENILIVGDGTPNQHGFVAGEWLNDFGWGNGIIKNSWFHKCGADGFRVNYCAGFVLTKVGASHCGQTGFRSSNVSGLTFLDTVVACYNGNHGVNAVDGSMIEFFTGCTADLRRNTGYGAMIQSKSHLQVGSGTFRVKNNTLGGVSIFGAGYAGVQKLDGGSNTGADIIANSGSFAISQSAVSATYSPAANTLGNTQSYIQVI